MRDIQPGKTKQAGYINFLRAMEEHLMNWKLKGKCNTKWYILLSSEEFTAFLFLVT